MWLILPATTSKQAQPELFFSPWLWRGQFCHFIQAFNQSDNFATSEFVIIIRLATYDVSVMCNFVPSTGNVVDITVIIPAGFVGRVVVWLWWLWLVGKSTICILFDNLAWSNVSSRLFVPTIYNLNDSCSLANEGEKLCRVHAFCVIWFCYNHR